MIYGFNKCPEVGLEPAIKCEMPEVCVGVKRVSRWNPLRVAAAARHMKSNTPLRLERLGTARKHQLHPHSHRHTPPLLSPLSTAVCASARETSRKKEKKTSLNGRRELDNRVESSFQSKCAHISAAASLPAEPPGDT